MHEAEAIMQSAASAIIHSASDAIITIDADQRIRLFNAAAEKLFGYQAADILGQELNRLIPERFHQVHGEHVRHFSQSGVTSRSMRSPGELYARRADGSEFPIEALISRVEVKGDTLLTVILRDITRRKQAEAALQASEERYRAVSDLTSDFAYFLQLHPGQNVVVEWITDAFTRITGFAPEALNGHGWQQIIHPDDLPGVQQKVAVSRSRPYVHEFRIVTKSGDVRWLRNHAQPLWDEDQQRVCGLYGAAQDNTERKRIEEAMRRAQKLESLGVLAGGIAHDFNNLLAAIIAEDSLALIKLPEQSPARQNVRKAIEVAERAADLTHQLLAYSGKGHFQLTTIDLNRLIEDNLVLLRATVAKNVSLQAELMPNLPPILANPGQVQQVVMNLIINAAESYDERPGTVSVSTDLKSISEADHSWFAGAHSLSPGLYVRLTISDRGKGMDSDTLGRIFDPFFTTKTRGRGLGLAAVQGIVQNHNGAMRVTSAAGQGSLFQVLLPVSQQPLEPESPPAITELDSHGLILVVEDEKVLRHAMAEILELAGFTVLLAEDGRAGVDLFEQHADAIDLVLLDMKMPVMSGNDALRQLRQQRPDVPVLLLSGYDEQQIGEDLLNGGLVSFLQKPFKIDALTIRVQEILNNKAAPTPHQPG